MLGRNIAILSCFICVASGATFAVRDVTVIDPASGSSTPHATVVVRGDKVVTLGPARTTAIPKGARIIEGRGKFLIPGLWDMHVHLWYDRNQLPAYVAQGITGVRDMGSDFQRVSAWRKEVLAGKAVGPHILTCGPAVTGAPSEEPKLPSLVASTPEEARRVVDRLEDMGVDFIKVLGNVPFDAYIALAERARHEDLDFAGHVPTAATAWDAVEARQNSIEHLFGMTKALADDPAKPLDTFSEVRLKAFSERSVLFGVWQVPTLTLWQRMLAPPVQDPRLKTVSAAVRATWSKPDPAPEGENADLLRRQIDLLRRVVVLMQRFGVGLLAGTDTGDPYTIPGVTLHDELQLLVSAGLTPLEALRSATSAPAKFIGWEHSAGCIQPGFLADLVLLDADPLEDIRSVGKIAGVAARGQWFDRPALARIRAASLR